MITDKDIDKLSKVFATKSDLQEVKEDVASIKETVQGLVTGVDKILGRLDNFNHEYVALKLSDDRQNRQIHQIAKKVDIKLET